MFKIKVLYCLVKKNENNCIYLSNGAGNCPLGTDGDLKLPTVVLYHNPSGIRLGSPPPLVPRRRHGHCCRASSCPRAQRPHSSEYEGKRVLGRPLRSAAGPGKRPGVGDNGKGHSGAGRGPSTRAQRGSRAGDQTVASSSAPQKSPRLSDARCLF